MGKDATVITAQITRHSDYCTMIHPPTKFAEKDLLVSGVPVFKQHGTLRDVDHSLKLEASSNSTTWKVPTLELRYME